MLKFIFTSEKKHLKQGKVQEGGKVLLNHGRKEDSWGGGRSDHGAFNTSSLSTKLAWWEWGGVEILKCDLEGLFESVVVLIDGYGNELLQFSEGDAAQAFINMLA
ncbi:hypothetical protein RHMOL_Rhmol04G0261800 [Rhododendron molle]|uniref:Uncharacterized protein n=1 Tax=Rhododendron molle TaxID=49168 RepID=A0ACC0P4C7_RHOML|nr:hypothetical protein RHMOL_Rhmol04G0261800 [Rhododendron molle]